MSSTPSSERTPGAVTSRPWYVRPIAVVPVAALTGLIAVSAAAVAVGSADGRALNLAVALFTGSASLLMLLGLGGDGTRWSMAELDSRPAWRLRLGPAPRRSVGTVLVLTVLGGGLLLAAAASMLRGTPGGIVLGVLVALGALGLLLVAIETARAAVRRPALLIGADRLRYDGAGLTAELGWADVGTVEMQAQQKGGPVLRISAAADASTYRVARRSSLLPLDRVPDQPAIDLRLWQIADPLQLTRLLRELHTGGRPLRESLIARGLPDPSGR